MIYLSHVRKPVSQGECFYSPFYLSIGKQKTLLSASPGQLQYSIFQMFRTHRMMNNTHPEKINKYGCLRPVLSMVGNAHPALSRWPHFSRKPLGLWDSGHNHQGVNSPAYRQSLLKQTGKLGSQSSSEDFGFELRTSNPWLRANPGGRPLNRLHLDRGGNAHPTGFTG